jgi:non-heme chloroperoxidase
MSTGQDASVGNGVVVTADGVHLRYVDQGAGLPVVFVHGWLSCAEHWHQVAASIAGTARAVTYDQRGHGASDGTEHGWTVHRLAHDLDELLTTLNISGAVLVGHSMGCSVIWAYLELFGASRVDRLILVDESPALVIDPDWDQATIARAGAIFSDEELRALCRGVADPESREQVTRQILTGMVTPACPNAILDRVLAWSLRVDGCYAAALLHNHAQQDWRRQIAHLTLPTLVIAGRASIVPWTGAQWIADTIPGARLEIFEADEGGSHFLALENPGKFHRLLADFIS